MASEGLQFTTPTLGDEAANQVLVGVQQLAAVVEELRQLRRELNVSFIPNDPLLDLDAYANNTTNEEDEIDRELEAFLSNRKK